MAKRPGMGKKGKPGIKPGMTRLKTVWVTQQSKTDFKDDYSILKQIGEPGQFGKAYQCKRKSDGMISAVKEISKARIYRLHPSDNIRQSLLKSMQAEIDIMRRLKHRYIVNMHGTYETKHTLHIVMEECKGGELFDRIKSKRRYPEVEAKPIVKMVCAALFYMHDQHRVVHCDLKPDNILFVNDSEESDIKIIDFGMSKVLPRLRSLRELCGTPYYTAPEIINGDYSHAADMWSVGVIAYVMILGFPPFYVNPEKFHGVEETKMIYKLILKGFDPQVKKGYGPWFPRTLSNKLGTNGMDFIGSLMTIDVDKRLTAKEALQHPWLKTEESNPENMDLTLLQLSNFATAHKFKWVIAALFAEQYRNTRPKHFEELKKLFCYLDNDGDGKISYEDFEEGMIKCSDSKPDPNKMKQIFAELDVAKAGEIEFDNLLNAVVYDYLVSSDARLYKAFRYLDASDSGHIQTALLKKKLVEMDPNGNVEVNDMVLQSIDDVDLDNSGSIGYDAFLMVLHPDLCHTSSKDLEKAKSGHGKIMSNINQVQTQEEEEEHVESLDMCVESAVYI
eukprot:59799_1